VRATAHELAAGDCPERTAWHCRDPARTLRADLADRVARATEHSCASRASLRNTQGFKEGVKAMAERRLPNFAGT
jgi:hypothetical protein